MLKFVRKWERWDKLEYRDDIDETVLDHGQESAEDKVITDEDREMANRIVANLIPKLNERERSVLYNMIITDDPESVRTLAKWFQCGKSSIQRDHDRIRKLLKEEGDKWI